MEVEGETDGWMDRQIGGESEEKEKNEKTTDKREKEEKDGKQ